MCKRYWIHIAVMLLASLICMCWVVWPDVFYQESFAVWIMCLTGVWIFGGSVFGTFGCIAGGIVCFTLWPLALAKLSVISKRFLWGAVFMNLVAVLVSMLITKERLQSGLFM